MDYNNKKGALLILSVALLVFVLIVVSKIGRDTSNPEPVAEPALVNQDPFLEINKLLDSGKYGDVISFYEGKGVDYLSREEKVKLVSAYMGKGNYYYKEKEFSDKALSILNTMENDYATLYYKGYAKEIIKDYTGALADYDSGLELTNLSDNQKSVLLNQKGHLYDLKGDVELAFTNYEESYELDNDNLDAITNLGRHYARKGHHEKAILNFKQTLDKGLSSPEMAETYFTLSSLQLEVGGTTPDIDKSIEYAKSAISAYPEYPMGYVALAKGLYMKNDAMLFDEIKQNLDKAIQINPNIYYAYEMYGLLEYDKGNLENFLEMFKKADAAIDDDMILMDNQRGLEKTLLNFKYYILSEINKNIDDKEGMFTFLNNLIEMESGKSIILQQVKRVNSGILSFLSGEERFDILLKDLNK